jgi:tetratricopeptide (TPR) repeat protein
MIRWLLGVFLLASSHTLFAQEAWISADTLWVDSAAVVNEEAMYRQFKADLEADPSSAEALIGASYYASRIGNRQPEGPRKIFFEEAIALAEEALDRYPERADAHLAMAIAQGRLALIAPARVRMEASQAIRRYAESALAIDPELAGAWHIIGLWHFRMANLSNAERDAGLALYGHAPTGASMDSSLVYLERAVDLRPDFLLYRYNHIRALRLAGHKQEAETALDALLALPPITPDDAGILAKAQQWLDEQAAEER